MEEQKYDDPNVVPIHDQTAADLAAAENTDEDVTDEEDEVDAPAASHNVFENVDLPSGTTVSTEAELDPEKNYEGGCAS